MIRARNISSTLLLLLLLALPGCIYAVPAPGGSDSVNRHFFKSPDDLQAHLSQVRPGMTEGQAFGAFGVPKENFTALDEEEIWRVELTRGAAAGKLLAAGRRHALTGYRFRYKQVKREHGLSSPISIQTNENGYDYEITMIFDDGKLSSRPNLAGGLVSGISNSTIFDYLTPGTALHYTH